MRRHLHVRARHPTIGGRAWRVPPSRTVMPTLTTSTATPATTLHYQDLGEGSPVVLRPPQVSCDRLNCTLQSAVAVPLVVRQR